MAIPTRRFVWAVIAMIYATPLLAAIDDPDLGGDPAEPLSAVELTRLILDGTVREVTASDSVDTDGEFSHYDALGFPETAAGRLVVKLEPFGPATRPRGENASFLLYARYSNVQRDAVLFARAGQISDPLPDGNVYTVPFGFGAIRKNTVDISVVEGIIVPHVSDNQKMYTEFPLFDLYAGFMAGTDGIGVGLRGVLRERYTAHLGVGVSSARYLDDGQLRRSPVGSFSAGGGLRFPGILPELIGPNLITIGGDVSVEVRGSDLGGGTSVSPGAFVEMERVFFDRSAEDRDYRLDPRPFNYRVHSVFARFTGQIDQDGISVGDPFRVGISIGYRVNIVGPRIPEHDFKRTEIVYVAEEYLEDLRRQVERRNARSRVESE